MSLEKLYFAGILLASLGESTEGIANYIYTNNIDFLSSSIESFFYINSIGIFVFLFIGLMCGSPSDDLSDDEISNDYIDDE